ncbi:MAG: hypothetical protein C5S49_04510 [Candidatus Methanogaster sp.]|nr:MAG: hypothetical protein C5S49_04510 [ANME-2 cluster archaeon]
MSLSGAYGEDWRSGAIMSQGRSIILWMLVHTRCGDCRGAGVDGDMG